MVLPRIRKIEGDGIHAQNPIQNPKSCELRPTDITFLKFPNTLYAKAMNVTFSKVYLAIFGHELPNPAYEPIPVPASANPLTDFALPALTMA